LRIPGFLASFYEKAIDKYIYHLRFKEIFFKSSIPEFAIPNSCLKAEEVES